MRISNFKCIMCWKIVSFDELVDIDIMHTVTHHNCNTERPIKETDTLNEITIKYPYFEPFLQHE